MKIALTSLLSFLEPLAIKGNIGNIIIDEISDDSRRVSPSTLFFAIKGVARDGHDFVPQVARTVPAVVVERLIEGVECPQIIVSSSKDSYLMALQVIYKVSLSDFTFIGITGTNGKTTYTYLMESILKNCGRRPAVIGTINYRFFDIQKEAVNTTPHLKELIPIFKEFKDGGCDAVIMEVSSHALSQKRLEGIKFDSACFSNLTPEHLDYHKDMEDYYQSKKLLFTDYLKDGGRGIINIDDSYGYRLFSELNREEKYSFSFEKEGIFRCRVLSHSDEGIEVEIKGMGISDVIKTELKGYFNAYNVASAYITGFLLGLDREKIKEGIFALKGVPGRLEEVRNDLGIKVFVDYAHTPDALLNILKATREITKNRIILVFGCGGDRDKTKRPIMGKIAVQHADKVIITSDNPRTESPMSIIEDIKKGIEANNEKVFLEPDRENAIFEAIFSADEGDTVLIAGKGHEDYQIIGDKKIHFSDYEVAKRALEKKRCLGRQ